MGDEAIATIVVILFCAAALLYIRQRSSEAPADERGLPLELRGAELVYAERTFRSHRRRLVARVDRAYKIDGEIKLLELKTRARDVVYMSDIIELSVQRVAVQDDEGAAVSNDAWVVVECAVNGARRSHKVRLLGLGEVTAMSERYRGIMKGEVSQPSPARSSSQCTWCPHLIRCAERFRDR